MRLPRSSPLRRSAPILAAAWLAACGGPDASQEPTTPTQKPTSPRVSLRLDVDTLRINMFAQPYRLRASLTRGAVVTPDAGVRWSVLGPPVVEMPAHGLVVGRANGTARIEARVHLAEENVTLADTAVVVVRQIVASVEMTPARFGLLQGDTVTLTATPRDSAGWTVHDAPVSWRSSAPGVVPVTPAGLVTAASPGTAVMSASVPSFGDSGPLTAEASVHAALTSGVVQLASGGQQSCALTAEGAVFCWGERGGTFPPDGPITVGDLPTRVQGAPPLVVIDVGYFHGCGLDAGGTAYCWGGNGFGQLGAGDAGQSPVPTARPVAGGHTFRKIAAGNTHTCAIATDGATYCWGSNDQGELGAGGVGVYVTQPARVAGEQAFVELDAGSRLTCGLTAAGRAYCWGGNTGYRLGTDAVPPGAGSPVPVPVLGDRSFRTLRAVGSDVCAISGESDVHCWGANWLEQLGGGNVRHLIGPHLVDASRGIVELGTGTNVLFLSSDGLCGLTAAGAAYCWQPNGPLTPVAIPGAEAITAISTGNDRSCALAVSSRIYCWGPGWIGGMGTGRAGKADVPVRISLPF